MLGAVSLISILLGGALAYASARIPSRVELLEGGGGACLVFGAALLGTGLRLFV